MSESAARTPRHCACGDHGFMLLTKGLTAFVSPIDVETIANIKWHASLSAVGYSYVGGTVDGKRTLLHRLLMRPPAGRVVDHRSGDRLDNRRENLRVCSHSQNSMNSKVRRRGLPKGVYQAHRNNRYKVVIMAAGRSHFIGRFHTVREAENAYDQAADRLHGRFARTNETSPRHRKGTE